MSDIRTLAARHTEQALSALIAVMEDENAPASVRVSAANTILDRGHGKATQTHAEVSKGGLIDLLAGLGGEAESETSSGAMASAAKPVCD